MVHHERVSLVRLHGIGVQLCGLFRGKIRVAGPCHPVYRVIGHHVQHEIALAQDGAESPFRFYGRIVMVRRSVVSQAQFPAVYILIIPADLLRKPGAAFGQVVAYSFPKGDLFHQQLGIPERPVLIQGQIRVDRFPFSQDSFPVKRLDVAHEGDQLPVAEPEFLHQVIPLPRKLGGPVDRDRHCTAADRFIAVARGQSHPASPGT